MLKVSKRTRDWSEDGMVLAPASPPLSPSTSTSTSTSSSSSSSFSTSSSTSFSLLDTPTKRQRPLLSGSSSSQQQSGNSNNNNNNTGSGRFSFEPLRPDSPFTSSSSSTSSQGGGIVELNNLLPHPNKLKFSTKQAQQQGLQQQSSTKPQNELTERMFSYNEVREIVNRAIAEKEVALRAEYDRILQELLQEQFRNFSKFNEDYISRQLKSNECSYLS